MDGRQDPELSLNAMKRRVREFYARQKELREAECRVNKRKAAESTLNSNYGMTKGVGGRVYKIQSSHGRGVSMKEIR